LTVGDAQTPAARLIVSGSSSNTTLVPDHNIAIGGSGPDLTVTVTPVADQTGTAIITIRVTDLSLVSTSSFLVNVPGTLSAFAVATLAGSTGNAGSADGTASAARFNSPNGVAVDSAGSIYVADGNAIRKITGGGVVTTLAGSVSAYGSADGTGIAARFYSPYGIAVDGAGNVYVADTFNYVIRKITSTGVVTTVAGKAGISGSTDGAGSAARFGLLYGIAVDSVGNLYVTDRGNSTVRKITNGGLVTTLAGATGNYGGANGTGNAASFFGLAGIAADNVGNLYVTEDGAYTIRKIASGGVVTTLAGTFRVYGTADGAGSTAQLTRLRGSQWITEAISTSQIVGILQFEKLQAVVS
jgi:hypothetical protein